MEEVSEKFSLQPSVCSATVPGIGSMKLVVHKRSGCRNEASFGAQQPQ